jgi:hypothetical protein
MALFGLYLTACALLVVAGATKAVKPGDTALALAQWPGRLGRLVSARRVRCAAACECALGTAAFASPARPLAALVAASYAVFCVVLVHGRSRGGVLATCGCFGEPDTPPTRLHVGVDVILLAGSLSVLVDGPGGSVVSLLSHQYASGLPLLAASALATVLIYVALGPLARLEALRATGSTGAPTPS